MKQTNPTALIATGSLFVAGICTVMIERGWLTWIPVLLAVIVVSNLQHKLKI